MALAWGYNITDILNMWASYGVFAYALPFLLIFAIVFGILNKTKLLGENKGVQATIALAMGLLALQFDYVTNFYATIFPYAGIGIAILLVAMILLGAAAGDLDWSKYVWFGIGALIFIVILYTSLSDNWFMGGMGYTLLEALPAVLAGLVILGVMALVVWAK